jgi:hypothetical protein
MKPTGNLYHYIHRCGAVEVQRATLPLLARDLRVHGRDLAKLIERMGSLGQVTSRGDVLRFSAPEVTR